MSRAPLAWHDGSMAVRVANGTLFNISWLAIVLSQSAVVAALVVVAHLCIHLATLGRGIAEAWFIGAVTLFGGLLDVALFRVGIFINADASPWPPLWMMCLWPVFATTLMHAFAGIEKSLLFAALVGAIGGGASYVAGTRLSGVAFADPVASPALVAALWAVLFPLLLLAAARVVRSSRDGSAA